MNMCILMSMNIYITPDNERRLRKELSMSGLINSLLRAHYEVLSKRDFGNPLLEDELRNVKEDHPRLNFRIYNGEVQGQHPTKLTWSNVNDIDFNE